MTNFKEFKNKMLSDPEVREEYDALEAEFDIIQAMIDARKNQHITQKELSERTGITQADISRIEKGTRNPSLEMVKRLAKGLGMRLKVEYIPRVNSYEKMEPLKFDMRSYANYVRENGIPAYEVTPDSMKKFSK